MSDFDEKFEQRRTTNSTKARATIKHLKDRLGFRQIDKETVHVRSMTGVEVWKKEDAVWFTLEGRVTVTPNGIVME